MTKGMSWSDERCSSVQQGGDVPLLHHDIMMESMACIVGVKSGDAERSDHPS